MRLDFLLSVFLISAILIVGCSSSAKDQVQRLPKTHIIEINQMKFVPEEIQVQAGDSIRWINKDIVAHNVLDETSNAWASPDLQNGESFITEVNTAGSYICNLHPVMKGKITVIDN